MIEHLFVFAASVMIAETTTKRTATNFQTNSINYDTYYSKILGNISTKKKMMMMYV